MPNALLDRLRDDFNTLRSQVEQTQNDAAAAGRDLTEAEDANVAELLQRAEALQPRIQHLVAQEASFGATSDALSRVTQGGSGQIMRAGSDIAPERAEAIIRSMYPSPGHYVMDLMLARGHVEGREKEAPDAQARIQRSQEVLRALANQLVADNPGLIPTPIVGDVIATLDASRPVWASFTQRPMPDSGKTFQRPIITQHTQVGVQATEKTEVASRKMIVNPLTLTKATYGGAVDISVQDVDWTDPAILTLVMADLADQYAIATDIAASTVLAAVTQTSVLPAAPTAAQINQWWYTAAGLVYAGAKRLPDTLWASIDMWGKLGGMVDADGRPLFPVNGTVPSGGSMSGPTSFGMSPLGLRFVVGPNLPAGTLIMGASRFAEAYEQNKGSVRAFEVSILGWEVGHYGYAVAAILVPGAFVKASTT